LRKQIVPLERITNKIVFIRKQSVMLDRDLAQLYEVEARVLNQAVKRNKDRFPDDFCFQLTHDEFKKWKSQIVMSNEDKMGLRRPPYAFTEQGVAMLSSVLRSKRAVQVNVAIMRAFVQLRKMAGNYAELLKRIEAIEKKYDKQFAVVFDAIKQLMMPPKKPRRKIGF